MREDIPNRDIPEPAADILAVIEGRSPWCVVCADCLQVLPTLPAGCVDAVVTDPPYGIGADEAASKNNGKWGWKYYGNTNWDASRPSERAFHEIVRVSRNQIVWGGNYFADLLPPSMGWLAWDKGQRDFSLADFELAWTSYQRAARCFPYPRARALQDVKEHPTQKPVALMRWCIELLGDGASVVCDPYMGSGTTGVACVQTGRRFIGIEIDEKYADIARRRIADAAPLFVPAPKAADPALFTQETTRERATL